MIRPLNLFLCALLLTATGQVGAAQNLQPRQLTQPSGYAALFEENILGLNAAAVRARAASLPDEIRFERLLEWVFPTGSHISIRMYGDFTQTNPSPVSRIDESEEHRAGGAVISPVFDLLDLARKLNRQNELLARVDTVPEANTDEQRRAKAAMQLLLQLETGKTDAAVKLLDQFMQLVRNSEASSHSEMWPETLVVYRCVVRKISLPEADDLLAFLFSQRTLRDIPQNAPAWHSQMAALAGQKGHRDTGGGVVAADLKLGLSQWVPISLRRAQSRGQCLAPARWVRSGARVDKISGHNDDYLFFRTPLTGDYEVQCDISNSITQAMTAGTFLGNDGTGPHLWIGTFRGSAKRVDSALKFSGVDEWIRYRSVVRRGVSTTSLNGLTVLSEETGNSPDPWFAVRNWWRMHSSAQDIRISGNPVIPESVDLSASPDLRGWYPYFEDSAGYPGAAWEYLSEGASSGQIVGHSGAPSESFSESLLAWQRPLDDVGSVQYEFFYEPGRSEVHPALDRMVFYLHSDGVRIHWLTDGPLDATGIAPDNFSDVSPGDKLATPLPLKPGEWNQLTIAVSQQRAKLLLNGQQICECEIDSSNDRVFGLFHYADQTEARVRSISMRGNWPRTLPHPSEQELADPRTVQVDSDLPKRGDVFTHDFSKNGFSPRYFHAVQIQPSGTVALQPNGLLIARPGGGPWFDIHVNLPFMVHGDFDIETEFDEFRAIGDEFGCIMFVVQLDDQKQQQCRILRTRDELQRQELHSSLSEVHADGARSYSARMPKKTEAVRGRLRMSRRGTTLYYMFAENDSPVFRVLETEEISDRPSVADGMHFHTMCNGKGETRALWKSITIRAERLTAKPDPDAKPLTNLYVMNADGSNIRLLAEPEPGFAQLGSFEWSADGKRLIGDMSKGGVDTSRVILLNADGSNRKNLGDGCMPSLSRDGAEIVFSQSGVGVMAMNVDGSNRRTLERNAWGVQWAPDGRTIALGSGNNITLLDVPSGKRRMLLPENQAGTFSRIAWNFGWSADSQSIGFKATLKTGQSTVNVADIGKSSALESVYGSPDYFPEDISFLPGAKAVILPGYTVDRTRAGLLVVDRNDKIPTFPFLEPLKNLNITGVDWSPDGKTIAFTATTLASPTEWPPE